MKKKGLIILIASIVVIVLSFLAIFYFSNIVPEVNYKNGAKAFDQKDFKQASIYYVKANYKNSDELYLRAAKAYISNTNENPNEVFDFINGNYKAEDHLDAYYIDKLIDNGKVEEAKTLYEKLPEDEKEVEEHMLNGWKIDILTDQSTETYERIMNEVEQAYKKSEKEEYLDLLEPVYNYLLKVYGDIIENDSLMVNEYRNKIVHVAKAKGQSLDYMSIEFVLKGHTFYDIQLNGERGERITFNEDHTFDSYTIDNIHDSGTWKNDYGITLKYNGYTSSYSSDYAIYKVSENYYLFGGKNYSYIRERV